MNCNACKYSWHNAETNKIKCNLLNVFCHRIENNNVNNLTYIYEPDEKADQCPGTTRYDELSKEFMANHSHR